MNTADSERKEAIKRARPEVQRRVREWLSAARETKKAREEAARRDQEQVERYLNRLRRLNIIARKDPQFANPYSVIRSPAQDTESLPDQVVESAAKKKK